MGSGCCNGHASRAATDPEPQKKTAAHRCAAAFSPSGDVPSAAVEIHDLGPGADEVLHEPRIAVARAVHFGDRTQLGVRAEDEVDGCGRPLHGTGLAIAAL